MFLTLSPLKASCSLYSRCSNHMYRHWETKQHMACDLFHRLPSMMWHLYLWDKVDCFASGLHFFHHHGDLTPSRLHDLEKLGMGPDWGLVVRQSLRLECVKQGTCAHVLYCTVLAANREVVADGKYSSGCWVQSPVQFLSDPCASVSESVGFVSHSVQPLGDPSPWTDAVNPINTLADEAGCQTWRP